MRLLSPEIERIMSNKSAARPAAASEVPPVDHEKRGAPRRAAALPAHIEAEGLFNGLPCTIVDMSASGVRLKIDDRGPQSSMGHWNGTGRIKLQIRVDRTEVDGWVMWRDDNVVGVKFMSCMRPMPGRHAA